MWVRAALPADSSSILTINAGCRPAVAPLDPWELRRLTALASVMLVAGVDAVKAYLIAMLSGDAYDGEEFVHFRTALSEPFLYVDQVAVHAQARGAGWARQLYDHAGRCASARGIRLLCCEVNLDPPNPHSLAFHEHLGFRRIGELQTRDRRRVALLMREMVHSEDRGR